MTTSKKLLSRSELAERWGKHPRTIRRMELSPPSGFPTTMVINGRFHFSVDAVEAFERSLAGCLARDAA